ncbi:MAG TPA: transglutaminase domain-containing protein [Symbiobacteriaceae bacterium]|nr:transglutaminase domain-containing protein [Symbiobacteriaceae bacterium]
MYANDSHAPGSVDRVLLEEMVFLCPETEAYLYTQFTPLDLRYRPGSRPVLEACLKQAVAGCGSPEEQVRAIVAHTSGLGASVTDDLDALQLGGTEEEILQRSTDWCTDLARVGCLLFQLAGLPARILVLADTEQAYSGHVITEVYRSGVWGAVDTTTGTVYLDGQGRPRSAAAIMRSGDVSQFRAVGVANYFVWEAGKYTYAVSGINPYLRPILEMSQRGWPGGLRWLHGE